MLLVIEFSCLLSICRENEHKVLLLRIGENKATDVQQDCKDLKTTEDLMTLIMVCSQVFCM